MVKCWPLSMDQNLICILLGAGEIPWGFVIKFIPIHIFKQLSLEAKDLEAEAQRTHISVAVKGKNKKKKVEDNNETDKN